MADYSALAQKLVAPIYEPMEQNLNQQVAEAQNDPYYNSLIQGLDAAKNKAFAGIEGRAAARGVAYGNIPSQQQAVYTGEKYLPAVAEVKKTQLDRINALKQTLAELRSKRAESVLGQVNIYEDRDFQARQKAMDRAASASNPSVTELNYANEQGVSGAAKALRDKLVGMNPDQLNVWATQFSNGTHGGRNARDVAYNLLLDKYGSKYTDAITSAVYGNNEVGGYFSGDWYNPTAPKVFAGPPIPK